MLWHAIIPDVEFERLLTKSRREILDAVLAGELPPDSAEFLFALFANCFTNEYVYAVSDVEMAGVEILIGATSRFRR